MLSLLTHLPEPGGGRGRLVRDPLVLTQPLPPPTLSPSLPHMNYTCVNTKLCKCGPRTTYEFSISTTITMVELWSLVHIEEEETLH